MKRLITADTKILYGEKQAWCEMICQESIDKFATGISIEKGRADHAKLFNGKNAAVDQWFLDDG